MSEFYPNTIASKIEPAQDEGDVTAWIRMADEARERIAEREKVVSELREAAASNISLGDFYDKYISCRERNQYLSLEVGFGKYFQYKVIELTRGVDYEKIQKKILKIVAKKIIG